MQKHSFSLEWKNFPGEGTLDYLSAGRQNNDYAITLAGLNWDDFYERQGGGQFFDGTRTEIGYRGRVGVTSRLGIEPGIAFNWVDLPEGSFFAKLLTARATYNLSPRQALMALVQYNSEGHVIGANVRFRWEFRPGSDLFVVYNEGRDTTLGVDRSELSSRSFVVKVTRLFRF